MENINHHIRKLGMKARDRVTGYEGVITSISFDLYGCIQAIITPPAKEDGTLVSGNWFDTNRLEILSDGPVMEQPRYDWCHEAVARGEKGCAEKPAPMKP